MVEDTVWVKEGFVRPRLSSDELWLIYRLVDNQYWLLRRQPHRLWDIAQVAKLRRKLMRLVNKCRTPKYRLSLRQRLY